MKTSSLFLLLTVTIIGIVIAFPHVMLSPGDLYQAHSDVKNNCLACHQPFSGTPNENCIACHKVKEIGSNSENRVTDLSKISKLSFHQNLQGQSCVSCHSDHKGTHAAAALKSFDHILLSESTRNQCINCHATPKNNLHQQVSTSCVSCHATRSWTVGVAFNHSAITENKRTNCSACHQSPKDVFHTPLTVACQSCHSVKQWKPTTFNHNAAFVLDQNHNTDCKVCHTTPNFKNYTCYGCHEHSLTNIQAEHREEGITTTVSNCIVCHKSANEHEITMDKNAVKRYNNESKNESDKEGED